MCSHHVNEHIYISRSLLHYIEKHEFRIQHLHVSRMFSYTQRTHASAYINFKLNIFFAYALHTHRIPVPAQGFSYLMLYMIRHKHMYIAEPGKGIYSKHLHKLSS